MCGRVLLFSLVASLCRGSPSAPLNEPSFLSPADPQVWSLQLNATGNHAPVTDLCDSNIIEFVKHRFDQAYDGARGSQATRCYPPGYSATDRMGAVGYVRKLSRQVRKAALARGISVTFLDIDTKISQSINARPLLRAFSHDIAEHMQINVENKVEVVNFLMCKNDLVSSLRKSHLQRDIGAAAQGWLPGFIISAVAPIGKAILSVLFAVFPVIPYIIKGMAQALVDLITFSVVNTVSDIVLGPETGMLKEAIVQEIVFGVVPTISLMITGHFTIRLVKASIPDIAQALSAYLRKESIPTIVSSTSHSMSNFISEALTAQLPKRITKALTFTLSTSLTHAVPQYYYCQYCHEKNEYCGYCYGYWRSVGAERKWWKKPEGAIENDPGARTVQASSKIFG